MNKKGGKFMKQYKRIFSVLSVLMIASVFFIGCRIGSNGKMFRLTLVHVNDTHSHLEPMTGSVQLNGEKTYLDMGGFSRLSSKIQSVRDESENTLVLHGGDAVQGSLYFTKYEGKAEFDFLNMMAFDAMTIGNHEFDRGPEYLSNFISYAEFPIISANIDAENEPALSGQIKGYMIKEFDGEKVGVIGLTTPDTAVASSPGDAVIFEDEKTAAARAVKELEDQGINKIIAVTHLGYEKDIELAEAVDGIDVIVGGHTHTLLGDYTDLGLTSAGEYPTKVQSPSGQDVYIVQSWEWAKTAGVLDIEFDEGGNVENCQGNAVLLVGDTFQQKDSEDNTVPVDEAKKTELLDIIGSSPVIEVTEEDPDALALLETYKAGIDEIRNKVIGVAQEDLLHIRVPGTHTSGEEMPNGSYIAPIVAEAMLWKVNDVGQDVQISLENAGVVRIDVPSGDITVETAYALLPFGNSLYILELTGSEFKAALQAGVTRGGGAFPYVAGARYTADMTKPEGEQIVSVEVKDADGNWGAIDDSATYRVVTNSYLADGGDGYDVMGNALGYRYDSGFMEAESFMEYAEHIGTLYRPQDTGITYLTETSPPAGDARYFAVFSDPHYYDADLGTSGAAFEGYLAYDRKLLRESEAILKAAIEGIKNQGEIDFVIIPGDLTKDGELSGHEEVAAYLKTLEDDGIQVYVIPGNHDVSNPHAYAYDGGDVTQTENVSPEKFAEIYADYGYGESLDRDPNSLSYVAEPLPDVWLLAMDSCRYNENEALGTPVVAGRFSQETLDWILEKLGQAEARNKKVIGMMHHGLLEHFTGQSVANPGAEYVIEDWETVSETLAKAGLNLVFTGHYHAQDITSKTWEADGETVTLTDAETGSLVTYPNPYRIVTLDADGSTDIESVYITSADYDTGGIPFNDYSQAYLSEGLMGLAHYTLTLPADEGGYGLPDAQANALAPQITAAYMAHYAGDETPSEEILGIISAYVQSEDLTTQLLGKTLYSLWTDLPPADNMTTILP
jgi:5'-nucleotidase